MRSNNYFAALIFFSILGLITSTVFSSIILNQVTSIKDRLMSQGDRSSK